LPTPDSPNNITFIGLSYEDTCPENQISINALGNDCKSIEDIIEKSDLEFDLDNLLYLASNNQGKIEKSNYTLEIYKLNDERLQSLNIKKSKLYIPESCMKAMAEEENIKLDKSKGIVIIVFNYNKININNIPETFFVIRQTGEGSKIKYINSKTFDLSICHEDPILLDDKISIYDLKYNLSDNTTIDIDKIKYAKKLKIDLFDPHSDFLNDICFIFTSEYGTDVTLESRLEDYYQNITLCDENSSSHYMEFNYSENEKTLTYRCAYGFYENEEERLSYVDNIDSKMKMVFQSSNIKVITCFSELLDIRNFLTNYGAIICILTFIIQVILYIQFCCQGTKPLEDQINNEILIYIKNKNKEVDETSVVNNDNENEDKTDDRLKNKNKTEEENENIQNKEIKDVKKKKTTKKKGKKNAKNKKNKSNPPKKNKINEGIKQNNNLIVKSDVENLETNKNNKKTNQKGKADEKTEKNNTNNSGCCCKDNYDHEELNELPYDKALKKDTRNFCQYYIFILRAGHVVLNVFCRRDDYNLFSVKLGLLFMLFPINLTFNIFFFTSNKMKETYINKIEDVGTYLKNLLHSFLSSIFSSVILILLKFLCLTHSSIRKLKKLKTKEEAEKKSKWIIRCIKIRICVYYILSYVFLLVFGYYVACFCAVFKNTQIDLIMSMFTSWGLSLLYPFMIYFATSLTRIIGIGCKCKFIFKINQILQMI